MAAPPDGKGAGESRLAVSVISLVGVAFFAVLLAAVSFGYAAVIAGLLGYYAQTPKATSWAVGAGVTVAWLVAAAALSARAARADSQGRGPVMRFVSFAMLTVILPLVPVMAVGAVVGTFLIIAATLMRLAGLYGYPNYVVAALLSVALWMAAALSLRHELLDKTMDHGFKFGIGVLVIGCLLGLPFSEGTYLALLVAGTALWLACELLARWARRPDHVGAATPRGRRFVFAAVAAAATATQFVGLLGHFGFEAAKTWVEMHK